jgi:ABC-type nitrate/sulfonate/bicarbonate transport system substrate-binding protein
MSTTSTELRASAWAGGGEGLEVSRLSLGIIPLTDCAPLVVALERGHFARYGLEVTLKREASWANIRDKVALGALDGAQMLATMPIAMSLGVGGFKHPMVTAYSMDLNGNAITASNALYARMLEADPEAMGETPLSARALKKVIESDTAAGRPPMTFAMVFPGSTHELELRYWMAAAGIDPDRDVRLVVVPPPQMVDHLLSGSIAGFCVGEPWNAQAVSLGAGRTLVTKYEIWNNSPEKVFAVTRDWAERHPNTHRAVLMALLEAAQWMDRPENRAEVVRLICQPQYVDAPLEVVQRSMVGGFQYANGEPQRPFPDFNVFYRYAATFPWLSHAEWFISQMVRWGLLSAEGLDIQSAAAEVYRPQLYREAAAALGVPYPTVDRKREGRHGSAWVLTEATAPLAMGPDRFVDGKLFDPAMLDEYLKSLQG